MKRQERALLVTFGRCSNRVIFPLANEVSRGVTVAPLLYAISTSTCDSSQPSDLCEEFFRNIHTSFFQFLTFAALGTQGLH